MGKKLKSISVFFVFMFMLTAMLPSSVFAAQQTDERVAVYVQVPEDWENPCVWAWDEDGNNAFEAWPGGETEADTANEGWNYIWIPSWANHVIVNANDGSVQTGELILEGENVWLTVSDAETVDISYDSLTTGEAPEYVEKFEIHAKVDASWENPCLWAWSAPDGTNAFEAWPGKTMTADEDGWYTTKAPIWVNSIIINGNEGSVQTEDISIDPAEVWVTVEADGTYDFSYTDPNKAEIPNVSVYVMAPADWEAPCLWAWSAPDGTNVYSTWPGEAFEEGENGWLQKEIPGWVNSVIVNGNEGSVQTTDISVETGKDIWLVVTGPEEYEVYYEEPEVEADAEAADEQAVVEDTEVMADEDTADSESSNVMIWVIGAVAIVAVVVVVVVVKNKKKTAA